MRSLQMSGDAEQIDDDRCAKHPCKLRTSISVEVEVDDLATLRCCKQVDARPALAWRQQRSDVRLSKRRQTVLSASERLALATLQAWQRAGERRPRPGRSRLHLGCQRLQHRRVGEARQVR